jgi:hypothetical protein
MLLAREPVAFITTAVAPGVNSIALFLILFIKSFVLPPIWPGINAVSMDVVFLPMAYVLTAV